MSLQSPLLTAQDVLPFLPVQPREPADLGRIEALAHELIVKNVYIRGELSGLELSRYLRLPYVIVSRIIKVLAAEELLSVKSAAKTGDLGGDFTYILGPKGVLRAKGLMERNSYTGIVPVTMEEYQQVTADYMKATAANVEFEVTPEKVDSVFSRRIGYQELNHLIGQAAANRQSVFLHGGAGNGKTDLSFQIVHLLPPVILPYTVEFNRQIIAIFDESVHKPLPQFAALRGLDPRWVVCQAPMVTLGGEMTLADLDIKYDEKLKAHKAPPQVMANGGVLLIDDFGRQRCKPDEIFNRLIVPLENHFDFMVVDGSRLTVSTDEVIIFSSNLSLIDIMDPAFLRRIPYKIQMRDPTADEFSSIWKMMLGKLELIEDASTLNYLLAKYTKDQRPFKASQPRDLLRLVRNKLKYFKRLGAAIAPGDLDEAYATYFPAGICY